MSFRRENHLINREELNNKKVNRRIEQFEQIAKRLWKWENERWTLDNCLIILPTHLSPFIRAYAVVSFVYSVHICYRPRNQINIISFGIYTMRVCCVEFCCWLYFRSFHFYFHFPFSTINSHLFIHLCGTAVWWRWREGENSNVALWNWEMGLDFSFRYFFFVFVFFFLHEWRKEASDKFYIFSIVKLRKFCNSVCSFASAGDREEREQRYIIFNKKKKKTKLYKKANVEIETAS